MCPHRGTQRYRAISQRFRTADRFTAGRLNARTERESISYLGDRMRNAQPWRGWTFALHRCTGTKRGCWPFSRLANQIDRGRVICNGTEVPSFGTNLLLPLPPSPFAIRYTDFQMVKVRDPALLPCAGCKIIILCARARARELAARIVFFTWN